jgi:CheY-like chemotaxis protein
MNGEMLAQEIAQDPASAGTCLVMLTAAGNAAARDNFAEHGFSAYISKPVRTRQLIETLAVVWEKYKGGQAGPLIRVNAGALSNEMGPEPENEPKLEGARILLAEDSRINQAFAEDVLAQLGCKVTTVANGREALEAIRREEFDLVLMDCQMPVMDGFEAARCIRTLKEENAIAADLPVIALTANAMKGDRQKCLDAGMNDYLSKPVRIRDLKEKVYFSITRRKADFQDEEADAGKPQLQPAAPGLIDEYAVAEARRILRDRYGKMVECYIEDISGYLAEINAAIETGNFNQAARPAHTIKSASRRMGAIGLSRRAEDLEEIMRESGREAELFGLLAELSSLFESTQKFLLAGESARKQA